MASRVRTEATILIADDDDLIRLVVRTALEREGYTVVEARNGAEAVDRVRSQPVELAILDAHMPGLAIADTIAGLGDPSSATAPAILVLSGDPAVARRLSPSVGFLGKPVEVEVLLARVSELILDSGRKAQD